NGSVTSGSVTNGSKPAAEAKANGSSNGASRAAANGHAVPLSSANAELDSSLKERASLVTLGGKDVFEKAYLFKTADNARKTGMYPYFRPLDLNDGPEAVIDGKRVTMFGSNNYLGLTTHPRVREAAVKAIERFGTSMTGSRLV